MAIQINLLSPLPNARQVSVDTNLEFSITGDIDGYAADFSTLSIQINGVYAIISGVFQLPKASFSSSPLADGEAPLEPTRFYPIPSNPFMVGDKVQITDSVTALETTIISIVDNVVEFKDAFEVLPEEDRLPSYQIEITSISRGYSGSLTPTITVNPLQSLPSNAVVMTVVEVYSIAPVTSVPPAAEVPGTGTRVRKAFVFRTTDTQPPRLIDFPSVITNSNLSFKLFDLQNNFIPLDKINLFFNEDAAIQEGTVTSLFTGSLVAHEGSLVEVYVRPKQKFEHNEQLTARIQVADGYGNATTYTKSLLNKSAIPQVELLEIVPINESVIDPTNSTVVLNLRVSEQLDPRFINLSYEVSGVVNPDTGEARLPIIELGEFTSRENFIAQYGMHTGLIRSVGRDVYIRVDSLRAASFNKKIKLFLTLQEVTDLGDIPVGLAPFYTKQLNYTTIAATIKPIITNLVPADGSVVSASTPIRFSVTSKVQGAPIDISSISVSIDNTRLAIDNGFFVNGWTGTILAKQGSSGHTVNVIMIQPPGEEFEVGVHAELNITASDIAQNTIDFTSSFDIINTNAPVVTVDPPGGVFKKLTRIVIESDQPATIYYTIDGSKPIIGNVSTFTQTSPVLNVPIYREGVTQIKAFGVSSTGVSGPIVTAIFDLNPFVPEIKILSPAQQTLLDKPAALIAYEVVLKRGFLSLMQVSVNGGPLLDIQNTLLASSLSVSGLRSGANTVELVATDNAGNVGRSRIALNVKSSQIIDFGIKYAPLVCPEFTHRLLTQEQTSSDLIDTATVAIIGLGSRQETLVSYGVGNGEDGQPRKFVVTNAPDGRHFQVRSFPIRSHTLFLYRKGRTITLPAEEYVINLSSGQIVLDHPIETGESLTIHYVAEPDINSPTLFTSSQLDALFVKHGRPSKDNTLSLAAQMAFENGAVRILAVQGELPSIDAGWFESFKALETEQAYWITPVVRNEEVELYDEILLNAFNHVENLSQIGNRKERIVAGWRKPDSLNNFGQSRIFLASIDQNPRITRVVNGELTDLNGSFVAAAISGRGSSLAPVSLPLTQREISGFTLHTTKRSPKLDLEKVVNQGFMPIQALAAGASIYRGRSAYVGITDPTKEELSVQRIADYISKELRRLADNRFRGQILTSSTVKGIGSEIQVYLNSKSSLISKGVLTNIEVDPLEPRQLNLEVTLIPLYPLNQFSITFTVSVGV